MTKHLKQTLSVLGREPKKWGNSDSLNKYVGFGKPFESITVDLKETSWCDLYHV